jgi:hypothetical protein
LLWGTFGDVVVGAGDTAGEGLATGAWAMNPIAGGREDANVRLANSKEDVINSKTVTQKVFKTAVFIEFSWDFRSDFYLLSYAISFVGGGLKRRFRSLQTTL